MQTTVIGTCNTFFGQFPSHEYRKGEILISANMQPRGIFFIETGIVRRYYLTEDGTEITLNLYKPHTFLPMSWALANIPNTHFYEAMTNVRVRIAPKNKVLRFLKEEPDVLYDLLRRIYIGMEGLWIHITSLTAGNSYIKLVTSLITLAKRFGEKQNNEVLIKNIMDERDLANYAGMRRETVSRELQKLKKDGLVSFDKKTIVVHDIQSMENMILK